MELKTFLITIKDGKVVNIQEFKIAKEASDELNKILDTIGTSEQKFDSAYIEHARDEDSLNLSVGDVVSVEGDEMDYQGPGNLSGRED